MLRCSELEKRQIRLCKWWMSEFMINWALTEDLISVWRKLHSLFSEVAFRHDLVRGYTLVFEHFTYFDLLKRGRPTQLAVRNRRFIWFLKSLNHLSWQVLNARGCKAGTATSFYRNLVAQVPVAVFADAERVEPLICMCGLNFNKVENFAAVVNLTVSQHKNPFGTLATVQVARNFQRVDYIGATVVCWHLLNMRLSLITIDIIVFNYV